MSEVINYKRPAFPVKNFFKKIFKRIGIFNFTVQFRTIFRSYMWPAERFLFRALRKNKKVCVIQVMGPNLGLFADFARILAGIAYADRRNMLPVADMKTFNNLYLYDDEVGVKNSWEYYFTQPSGISVDEAFSMKNFMTIDSVLCPNPRQRVQFFYNKYGQLDYWRNICKEYINFTPEVLARLEAMKTAHQGKRILGVLVRGTDYAASRPKGHPIPPTAEQAIEKVQEVMKSENFDSVYLATEDKIILEKFQAAFNDRLILPEAEYINYDYSKGNWLANYESNRQNDKYLRGLEYLVSMLFLAKCCKGFITCITSGSTGVMCLSEGFDYLYVFDLGLYP